VLATPGDLIGCGRGERTTGRSWFLGGGLRCCNFRLCNFGARRLGLLLGFGGRSGAGLGSTGPGKDLGGRELAACRGGCSRGGGRRFLVGRGGLGRCWCRSAARLGPRRGENVGCRGLACASFCSWFGGCGLGGRSGLGDAAGLPVAAGLAASFSVGFGSGSVTIFSAAGSMSYQAVLLNWSNSTRQRPFILTVLTVPVAWANRASSGADELITTYLSVHSDFSRSMTSNMCAFRREGRREGGKPAAPTQESDRSAGESQGTIGRPSKNASAGGFCRRRAGSQAGPIATAAPLTATMPCGPIE
jgi:hypothetical protein